MGDGDDVAVGLGGSISVGLAVGVGEGIGLGVPAPADAAPEVDGETESAVGLDCIALATPAAARDVLVTILTSAVGLATFGAEITGRRTSSKPAISAMAAITNVAIAHVGNRRWGEGGSQGNVVGRSNTPSAWAALYRGQAAQSPSRQVLVW